MHLMLEPGGSDSIRLQFKEYVDRNKVGIQSVESLLGPDNAFRFRCTGCGGCCKGGGNVYFSDEELEKIYDYLEIPKRKRRTFRMKFIRFKENGYHVHSSDIDCWFLEDNRCSIYPVRPMQCSTFPFWPSGFQSQDALKDLGQDCPGVNHTNSRLFTPLQTVRRVNATLRKFTGGQQDSPNLFML